MGLGTQCTLRSSVEGGGGSSLACGSGEARHTADSVYEVLDLRSVPLSPGPPFNPKLWVSEEGA